MTNAKFARWLYAAALAVFTISIATGANADKPAPFFEDFETYANGAALQKRWQSIDNSADLSLETQIVLGGRKALRLAYGSQPGVVELPFDSGQNWSAIGGLEIYYRGTNANGKAEVLVELTDSDGKSVAKGKLAKDARNEHWTPLALDLGSLEDRTRIHAVRITAQPTNGDDGVLYFDNLGISQAARWKKAMARFAKLDQDRAPAPSGVLFVGSSSIRMWDTNKWFPKQSVINRGFGGSQISDVNYFAEQLVFKHRPRVIIFYAGDNDVAAGKSAQRVVDDYDAFCRRVRQRLPKSHVIYIPIKPSLARWRLWSEMRDANDTIKKRSNDSRYLHYADTATPMLGEDGKPRGELFAKDGLHLSDEGYRLWSKIVAEAIATASQ